MAYINEEEKDKESLPSDTVQQAQLKLKQQLGNGYQSQWQTQLNDTMDKILNREKFSYDLNGDALYNQYKDQYITGGKMAMMDTMGQAAALTGGYGNSYAQGVGQQAYQGYLQGLNDKIPELYQLALDNYNAEGNAMLNQYGLLSDREADDYGRYQDQMALIQPQVLEMLQNGIRPSDEMIAASGLSKEYIDAMYPNMGAYGSGGSDLDEYFHKDGTVKLDKVTAGYRDTAAQYNIDLSGSENGGIGNTTWNKAHKDDPVKGFDDDTGLTIDDVWAWSEDENAFREGLKALGYSGQEYTDEMEKWRAEYSDNGR